MLLAAVGITIAAGQVQARITAVDDMFMTFRGQQIQITFGDLLENDVCTNKNPKPFCLTPLKVTSVIKGQVKGNLQVQNGKITFTPKPGFTIKSGNDGPHKEKLQIYLAGVLEALLTFNELNRSIDVNLICIPLGTRLDLPAFQASLDQVVELTRAEQKDFAAYAEQANISVIGLTALNREFPCSDLDQPARDGAAP
jgi:hypothetical protein